MPKQSSPISGYNTDAEGDSNTDFSELSFISTYKSTGVPTPEGNLDNFVPSQIIGKSSVLTLCPTPSRSGSGIDRSVGDIAMTNTNYSRSRGGDSDRDQQPEITATHTSLGGAHVRNNHEIEPLRPLTLVSDLTTDEQTQIFKSFRDYHNLNRKDGDPTLAETSWGKQYAVTGASLNFLKLTSPKRASCTKCWHTGSECSHFVTFKTDRVARSHNVTVDVLRDILAESSLESPSEPIIQRNTSNGKGFKERALLKSRGRPRSRKANNSNATSPSAVIEGSSSFGNLSRPTLFIVGSLEEIVEHLQGRTSTILDQDLHSRFGASIQSDHHRYHDFTQPPTSGAQRKHVFEPLIENDRNDFEAWNPTSGSIHDIRTNAAHNTWTHITRAREHLHHNNYAGVQLCLDMALEHCEKLNGSIRPNN
ncbi:hypothetical protein V5O48_004143 [Marasmius crinis-equi]|uniref:SWIM-type domain-containing protein n=1 Tax=Marasmius crinis-equi TaxID=585013 RepID=A0ABR3FQY5_9AGAR